MIEPYVHVYRRGGHIGSVEVHNRDGTVAALDRVTGVRFEQGHSDPGTATITLIGMRVRFHEDEA